METSLVKLIREKKLFEKNEKMFKRKTFDIFNIIYYFSNNYVWTKKQLNASVFNLIKSSNQI